MAIPHFNAVTSHNQNWEPIHKSLFEIAINLPVVLGSRVDEEKLLLENATSISLPVTPDLDTVSQRFKFSTRGYVGLPTETHLKDISIKFNLNQNDNNSIFVWKNLKDWYDLAWNSQTGETATKREMIGSIVVNMHDKKGRIIRRVVYKNIQILGLSAMELDWSGTGEILDVTAKFMCDYWFDLYV